jgi:hypothetical protein
MCKPRLLYNGSRNNGSSAVQTNNFVVAVMRCR